MHTNVARANQIRQRNGFKTCFNHGTVLLEKYACMEVYQPFSLSLSHSLALALSLDSEPFLSHSSSSMSRIKASRRTCNREKKATAMRERAWTTIHFQFNSLEHKRELLSLRRIKSLAKTVYQLNELFFSLDLAHSCSPLLHCVCTHLRWAHNWQRFLIEIHKEWKQQRKHEYYHWMLIKRKPHIQRNHSRSLLLSLCIFHISSYCHRPGKSWLDQCDAMWCVSSQFKCTTSLHVHLPSNWYNYCFPHVFFSRCRSFSLCVSFHQFIQMAGVELEVKMSFEIKQKKISIVLSDEWNLCRNFISNSAGAIKWNESSWRFLVLHAIARSF